ncbi:hypothetical protein DTO282E5_1350 [Paecilomyces variotii]|nr:hypothetical protein DTO282E5_1350 [Paecilomyces variotii]
MEILNTSQSLLSKKTLSLGFSKNITPHVRPRKIWLSLNWSGSRNSHVVGLACFHTIQSQRWLMVARAAPIPYANCLHALRGRKRFENRNDRRRVSFLRRPICRFPPIILHET